MKKWLAALMMITMLIVAGCGNGGDSGSTAGASNNNSTIQKVIKAKKLVVGTNPGYYPFEMVDTKGKFIGYDIDVAQAIADNLGVKLEVKQYGFDGLVPALQTGEIDMIFAGMSITGERALAVSFANPYYKTGQSIMLQANDNTTKSYEDLDKKGTKIATQIATTGSLLAKGIYKNAEIKDFEDFPAAALALQSGQVDAVIYDEPAIQVYNLQQKGKVKKMDGVISADNLGLAVQKNDFESLQWLNSFLHSYIDSPAELESRAKWFEKSDWLTTVKE
ncbi:transporter substrate-binding domain-containing protein [Viridibacillus sp. YIM B01967]|uniref:Transporter substrate-binding domain-containing protein n=1 Tax=Viridibacillus soli TaxID=2798301 RepID=A0ABS1H860_9BACL|nr:transporter substrate-binding domain-containing protein [Viridibacillus soli]MBK3495607.1 transporter substrate-binding domain-containing protein [Viridibacillus soli]